MEITEFYKLQFRYYDKGGWYDDPVILPDNFYILIDKIKQDKRIKKGIEMGIVYRIIKVEITETIIHYIHKGSDLA